MFKPTSGPSALHPTNRLSAFQPKDRVSFKKEETPLTVHALHDIAGLLWIEAADENGNRTWGTEESFRPWTQHPGRRSN